MKKIISLVAAVTCLSGCASQLEFGPSSVPIVPVKVTIDAMKCGLSKAVAQDRLGRGGLNGAVASVKFDVNVIEGRDASGSISAGIPIFQGAGTITPSFSFMNSETRTLNSSIDFDILISDAGRSVCQNGNYQIEADAGFSAWIGQVIDGLNSAVAGRPYAQMKQYIYESDFAVKVGTSAGIEVAIVPVKLNTSIGSSRSDIQHMKVTIKPVQFVVGAGGKQKKKEGGKPFFVPFSFPDDKKSDVQRRGSFNLK